VKQHYGFMILYKKKNSDLAEIDNLIDRTFILLGMTYPFVRFLTHSYAAKERLEGMGLSAQSESVWWFETLVFSAFVVSLILFAGRQAQKLYYEASGQHSKAASARCRGAHALDRVVVSRAGAATLGGSAGGGGHFDHLSQHPVPPDNLVSQSEQVREGNLKELRRRVHDQQERVDLYWICACIWRAVSHSALHHCKAR
jgi:hypothetical protein